MALGLDPHHDALVRNVSLHNSSGAAGSDAEGFRGAAAAANPFGNATGATGEDYQQVRANMTIRTVANIEIWQTLCISHQSVFIARFANAGRGS